jgi:hypothetical protein
LPFLVKCFNQQKHDKMIITNQRPDLHSVIESRAVSLTAPRNLFEKSAAFLLTPLSWTKRDIHPITKIFLILFAFSLWLPATLLGLGLWMASSAPLFTPFDKPAAVSLSAQYDWIHPRPMSTPPQFFFLGENHDDPRGRELNHQLIQALGEKGVVIAAECIQSNSQPLEPKEASEVLEGYQIRLPSIPSAFVFGWDIEGCKELQQNVYHGKRDPTPYIRNTFRDRTLSMIRTIGKIQDWVRKKSFEGPVFFLAGKDHLETPRGWETVSELCLAPFYQAVAECNGVILIPRHLRSRLDHGQR